VKVRTNRHHIIPRSRNGTDSPFNIAKVPIRKHELYHALFGNRTPQEIIRYLCMVFWNAKEVKSEANPKYHSP